MDTGQPNAQQSISWWPFHVLEEPGPDVIPKVQWHVSPPSGPEHTEHKEFASGHRRDMSPGCDSAIQLRDTEAVEAIATIACFPDDYRASLLHVDEEDSRQRKD
ncbi:hypothetical protein M409DRAFT_26320 [Zasmidium cellare ATCC 36951]|uniref:Uncharacterized protein n=1 Tax=Zasmidium cellare ATCC 36951 TaxID=1080233 RepID=A0A6A6C7W4_ZASCE|nr:uncharacterized protein M409DRAFT_26320 [Zasmidium cellare ATCC 36951]KAF2163277.1 hypothetical protein M409DRAFT_26320 [Zasmidium cellare ATCC 36951]